MRCLLFGLLLLCLCGTQVSGQDSVYTWDWSQDGNYLGGSILVWSGSQYLKSRLDRITVEDIGLLDAQSIWSFDRGATNNLNLNSRSYSDYLLIGSAVLPFTAYLSKEGRGEGWKITGMAVETLLLTDGVINILKATSKRVRPYIYNPEVPIEEKLTNEARYSFASGHTAIVATTSFFAAKVYADIFPDSQWKPVVWITAASLPALAGYFRYQAGNHFPTDVIAGYAIGATIGYLIPSLHLKKDKSSLSASIMPNGVYLSLRF